VSVSIDMEQVAGQTIQQLGGKNAMLVLELNAQRAAVSALEAEVERLTAEVERLTALVPQDADPGTGKIDPGAKPKTTEKTRAAEPPTG
jgi:hypothetical protein